MAERYVKDGNAASHVQPELSCSKGISASMCVLDVLGRCLSGQISYAEAHSLWQAAQDGKGVTEVEKKTLQYTLARMKYTPKAVSH